MQPQGSPRTLGVVVAATLLTLAMAWPVLRAPTTRVFGSEIVGRHHDPYTVMHQLEHPGPWTLYTQPASDWVGVVLARPFGGVAAYNLLVLASFPLATLFAWLLAWRLTGSTLASLVGAFAYGFAPYHVAHAAYHSHIAQTQWLPLYLLALCLSLERATLRRLLLLAASVLLLCLSSYYYGFIGAVLTPVALVGFWLARGQRDRRSLTLTAGLLALLAAAGWLAVRGLTDAGGLAFPREDLFRYSARWWATLVPPVEHPLLGDLASRIWERHGIGVGLLEQQLTLGVGLLALAGVAGVAWLRGRREHGLRVVPALALLAGAALACSLSPERSIGSLTLTRTSAILYELAPMFRAYARFGLVVLLAVAILAGLGAAALLTSRSRPARGAAVLLLALAALELTPLPPWRWRDVLPTRGHRWLADQPPPVRALDCADFSAAGERTAIGLFPHELRLAGASIGDCDEPRLGPRLAALGFTHLITRLPVIAGGCLAARPTPEGLSPVAHFEDSDVYAVEAAPATVYVARLEGFSWREYEADGSYRWMGPQGSLELVNAGATPRLVSLELTLGAFPRPRRLTVSLDGQALAELAVSTGRGARSVGPLRLEPGRSLLALRALEPAAIPDRILHNGDRRAVTVALWDWRWSEQQP